MHGRLIYTTCRKLFYSIYHGPGITFALKSPTSLHTIVDKSELVKDYEITIVVARTRITVTPIFSHHPSGMWTSVNNHISFAVYHVCRLQHITKTAVTKVAQQSNVCHAKGR